MQVITTPRPDSKYTQSLLAVDIWDGKTITFSFPKATQFVGYAGSTDNPTNGFSALNRDQKDAIRDALAEIASFAGLTFVELSGDEARGATIRFGLTDSTDAAFAYLPDENNRAGDVWFTSADYMEDPVLGTWAYNAILHEIGHALGLLHPHEPMVGRPMPLDRDFLGFTVMSYRSSPGADLYEGYKIDDGRYPQSYMLEDIAALQFAYGANFSARSGDTVYSFSSIDAAFYIDGVNQGVPFSNIARRTVWDGGGVDTYDFSSFSRSLTINLEPGETSWVATYTNSTHTVFSLSNAYQFEGDPRSLIENAIGGSGHDVITGNSADNMLFGMGFNDKLYGGDGNDVLDGGDGDDTLEGGEGDDLLMGGAWSDKLFGGAGNDVLYGGTHHDYLYGGDGNDKLSGGASFDQLFGNAGDDRLWGGGGTDRLHGNEGNDILKGEAGQDFLYGEEGEDALYGGDGNDWLDGGGGADRMVGGAGNDTYVIDSRNDVIVEGRDAGADTVQSPFDVILTSNLENATLLRSANSDLTGNDGNNILTGNDGNNVIDGRGGNDIMNGLAGDDVYYVDSEKDQVFEGDYVGIDTIWASCSYELNQPAINPYTGAAYGKGAAVEYLYLTGTGDDFAKGNDWGQTICGNDGSNVLLGRDGDDALFGMDGNDVLRADEGDDRLVGGSGSDTLNGGTGDDRLSGNGGNDRLLGGDGNDLLLGSSGTDRLDGGDGNDTIAGGTGRDIASGGLGSDTFTFSDGDLGGPRARATDTILDFSRSDDDVIDLSGIDAVSGGSDDAFTWIGRSDFSGIAGELRWEATDDGGVVLSMDTDGDGLADLALFLDGVNGVSQYDFLL